MKKQKLPDHIDRNRPNYTAKGMSYTASRSGHNLTGDALTLAVRGTLCRATKTPRMFGRLILRVCTGAEKGKPVYKLRLSAIGKTWLRKKQGKTLKAVCKHSTEKGYVLTDAETGKELHATPNAFEALEIFNQLNEG